MARPRACDACSLRKIRCAGQLPCPTCIKAGFQCTFEKRPRKSGPKGPRGTTRARVNEQLQNLRSEQTVPKPPISSSPIPDEVTNWNNDGLFTSPLVAVAPSPAPWESAFTLSDVCAYLETYNQRMYPVWPVINVARLISALSADTNNCETCALAFAVCAGTGAQLQLNCDTRESTGIGLPNGMNPIPLADRFAAEAERCRSEYDYRESTTIEAILVPFFLHIYYGAKGKRQTSSFLLREAVTLCQLLDLDKEKTYQGLDPEEESYRRRTFWLLYVTERGHAMQHGTASCLAKSIGLPSSDDQNKPQVLRAFHSLVRLFASVEGVLVDSEVSAGRPNQKCSREMLVRLQHELRQRDQWPVEWNEAQRSDISVTQQWLRMLVWQLSLSNVSMSSEPGEDSMSFTYPAHVSRDALRSISTVSLDALVVHGPGMQVKICDITNTLLDVMTCVHSLPPDMFVQTRQILHELCCYLVKLNSNQGNLDSIRKRLIESNLLLEPVSELRAISEEFYDDYETTHHIDGNDNDEMLEA
ncbi:hypothetical protein BDW59DRAFT_181849 [Aspergillus cavernicola]|uniref:Zn(2)-C6 fungal-type domain-containing protein n=1 Tax=Aspergillus cavernicola TaxID=176166 RepID=A0ABR4HTM3_9EURO